MARKGRILVAVAAVAALGMLLIPAAPASAAAAGSCTVSGGVTLSTPLSTTPSSGTYNFTSNTTLTCVGVISSVGVAGAGFVTSPGVYGNGLLATYLGPGDTCDHGSGNGTFSANIPKVGGGTLLVTGAYDFIRLGTVVIIRGSANSSPLAGLFQFTPDVGQTCVTTSVTHANVSGQAFVAGP